MSDGTAITREELVTMLWWFVGKPEAYESILQRYSESESVSDWAKKAIAWAINRQIVEGSNWNLTPKATALRCKLLLSWPVTASKCNAIS